MLAHYIITSRSILLSTMLQSSILANYTIYLYKYIITLQSTIKCIYLCSPTTGHGCLGAAQVRPGAAADEYNRDRNDAPSVTFAHRSSSLSRGGLGSTPSRVSTFISISSSTHLHLPFFFTSIIYFYKYIRTKHTTLIYRTAYHLKLHRT